MSMFNKMFAFLLVCSLALSSYAQEGTPIAPPAADEINIVNPRFDVPVQRRPLPPVPAAPAIKETMAPRPLDLKEIKIPANVKFNPDHPLLRTELPKVLPRPSSLPADLNTLLPPGKKIELNPNSPWLQNNTRLFYGAGEDKSTNLDPSTLPVPPNILEMMYMEAWVAITGKYYDPEKLANVDLGRQLEAVRGNLKTRQDLDAAINKLVGSVKDRWTQYTSLSELKAIVEAGENAEGRLGMHVTVDSRGLRRLDCLHHSSEAYKSNLLRRGDIIVSVGGKPLSSMNAGEIESVLLGEVGKKVEVVYIHDNRSEKIDLTYEADLPEVAETKVLPGKIAYLQFLHFGSEQEAINTVLTWGKFFQEHSDIRGIVLDLRCNQGGRVETAKLLSTVFLAKGSTIVVMSHRNGSILEETKSKASPLAAIFNKENKTKAVAGIDRKFQTLPMVVLTDSFTASSAELLCGALKDNGRADLVGETTYGKGVAYEEVPLLGAGILQVTVGEFSTPDGFKLNGKGLKPHHEARQSRGTKEDEQLAAGLKVLEEKISQPEKR
ncbi:MAG: hypothetical protein K2W82_16585 [Candidatus Obscuribacterales bacterium]|nr:hypothetical protein [Candidatus Obscuribacterales bacterium]